MYNVKVQILGQLANIYLIQFINATHRCNCTNITIRNITHTFHTTISKTNNFLGTYTLLHNQLMSKRKILNLITNIPNNYYILKPQENIRNTITLLLANSTT